MYLWPTPGRPGRVCLGSRRPALGRCVGGQPGPSGGEVRASGCGEGSALQAAFTSCPAVGGGGGGLGRTSSEAVTVNDSEPREREPRPQCDVDSELTGWARENLF